MILHINNPYLKDYEICSLSDYGSNPQQFNRDFSIELAKANIVCTLIAGMAGNTGMGMGGQSQGGNMQNSGSDC